MDTTSDSIEEYILRHIDAEPAYLKKLTRDTHLYTLKPRMLSGHLQGRMLKMFCNMVSPKNILEIGAFTGYSALCMAESLPEGGMLHTIEVNDEMEEFLDRVFSESDYADRITLHIGDALKVIPTLDVEFDVAFIDGNKRHYWEYFEAVYSKMRVGGLMIADNTLWDGHVLETETRDAQTLGVKKFNDRVAQDDRVERVIVPVRDGMTLIRKIK